MFKRRSDEEKRALAAEKDAAEAEAAAVIESRRRELLELVGADIHTDVDLTVGNLDRVETAMLVALAESGWCDPVSAIDFGNWKRSAEQRVSEAKIDLLEATRAMKTLEELGLATAGGGGVTPLGRALARRAVARG